MSPARFPGKNGPRNALPICWSARRSLGTTTGRHDKESETAATEGDASSFGATPIVNPPLEM